MEKIVNLSSDYKLKNWGYGEWVEELDGEFFVYKEIQCRVLRNPEYGDFLGYVKIPKNHPWFEKSVNNIDCDVHGGLSYAQIEEDGYWIGFDCSHSYDYSPGIESFRKKIEEKLKIKFPEPIKTSPIFNRTYKNISFCKNECKKLVDEMLSVGSKS